ncbi:hypothetical protein SUGI_0581070 [Cryptomeria japonica]|nr:hypothetical protein SUGI_0581070 [Cryptomeria japonica]
MSGSTPKRDFFGLMESYFSSVYDVKHAIKFYDGFYEGLNKRVLIDQIERIGLLTTFNQITAVVSSQPLILGFLKTQFIHRTKNNIRTGLRAGRNRKEVPLLL